MIDLGKLPPQAVDIEELVLSALLTDQECYWNVNSLLSKEVFYKDEHQVIFEVVDSMYQKNERVDIATVYQRLKANKKDVDPVRLSRIAGAISSSANIAYHCHILIEKATARKIISECSQLVSKAYDDGCDVIDLVDQIGKVNEDITAGIYGTDTFEHVSQFAADAYKDYQKREVLSNTGQVQGVPTGLSQLNKILLGWQNSDLIVLAARPAMGKTAMMLHHVITAARSGVPACIFSLEMSGISLANRLIMSVADVNADDFKRGRLTVSEMDNLNKAIAEIDQLPIYIDPNPSVTMRYIRTKARVMKNRGQCGIVFIDYLQLCDMRNDEKGRNREQEVSATSRMAKIIAKELDIPVVLLSQLNRDVEKRADRKPNLSDLRESGAIEQDADIVGFLYRPEYYIYDEQQKQEHKGKGEYIIAKHRSGATGTVIWGYNETMTDIHDFMEDVPVKQLIKPNEPF